MAELLVKAAEPWNNDSPTAPPERSRLGDIIVVRPDGWVWGNEENLPRFIIVKLPGVAVEDVKHYEESLIVDDGLDENNQPKTKMAKVRKYQVPSTTVQTQIDLSETILELPLSHGDQNPIEDFMNSIIEKTE